MSSCLLGTHSCIADKLNPIRVELIVKIDGRAHTNSRYATNNAVPKTDHMEPIQQISSRALSLQLLKSMDILTLNRLNAQLVSVRLFLCSFMSSQYIGIDDCAADNHLQPIHHIRFAGLSFILALAVADPYTINIGVSENATFATSIPLQCEESTHKILFPMLYIYTNFKIAINVLSFLR